MKEATNDLKAANEMLTSKLQQQDAQLARLERELRIEAALEKVRSRSLAMHHSTELEQVAGTLFDRLAELGLSFDGALIFIFDKDKRNISLWIATNHLSAPVKIDLPYDKAIENNIIIKDLWNAIENGEHIINRSYSGEVKNEYFRYVAKYNESKIPESIRQIQIEKESWTAHFAAEKNSIIGFDSWSGHPTTDDDFRILIRFAKVFEQAYTRFLDLQKAEAQAREAQIEAALEKIRSRSLAMHHSDELREIISHFFEKLIELEVLLGTVSIQLYDQHGMPSIFWVGNAIQDPQMVLLPYEDNINQEDNYLGDGWHAMVEQKDIINKVYSKEQKDRFFGHLFANNTLTQIPETAREVLRKMDSHVICLFPNKNSGLFVDSWDGRLYSEESIHILRRAGKVFEQAYTRFLDLQKAEARSREAQIEVAVERVRTKALAMHRSEEIMSVVQTLRLELGRLNIEGIFSASIHLKQDDGSVRLWDITINDVLDNAPSSSWDFNFRLEEMHSRLYIKRIWDATEKYFVFEQEEHDFPKLIEWVRKFKKEDADEIDRAIKEHNIKSTWFAAIQLTYGRMNIELMVPPAAEIESILSKIGAAFDLAYKRFLDLQRAEAQAREAQIEAALERVRSAAMAMRSSKDLFSVADVLRDQLSHLGKKDLESSIIHLYPENSPNFEAWYSYRPLNDPTAALVKDHISVPKDASSWTIEIMRKYHSQDETYTIESKGKMLEEWYHVMEKYAPATVEYDSAGKIVLPEVLYYHFSKFLGGALLMISDEEPDEEACTLHLRAAKVFELAYTRFKDLQKAEEQTREAQIQLALERVRARTMAMHQSNEIYEVAYTMFEQLKQLGFAFGGNTIMIMDSDTGNMDWWMAGLQEGQYPEPYRITYFDHPVQNQILDDWKTGKNFSVIHIHGELKKSYDEELFTRNGYKVLPENVKEWMQQRGSVDFSLAYMKHGALHWGPDLLSIEHIPILQRFAKVFEQTYTRFLDLKQAEERAWEAQIEAALEKVRGRSLAMHSSEELKEVVTTLFEKLKELGLVFDGGAGVKIFKKGTKDSVLWVAEPDLLSSPSEINLPYVEEVFSKNAMHLDIWNARETGTDLFNRTYSLEEKNEYFNYVFSSNNEVQFPQAAREWIKCTPGYTGSEAYEENTAVVISSWSKEHISEKQLEVLKRFARVFEQAYVRFLDLQRAEAQTREAQIEAALEKIRSRSLAMKYSEELRDVALTLFIKLDELKVAHNTVAIQLFDFETKDSIFWPGNLLQDEPPKVRLPYDEELMNEDTCHKDLWDAMSKGEIIFNKVYTKKQKDRWFQYVFANNDTDVIHPHAREFILNAEVHTVCFIPEKNSALFSDSWDGSFYTEEELNVLKRAAKVFEQAYIRFLDLQKAEASTRQAVRQAALDRVRAEIASMRSPEDLQRVTPVIWNELTTLSIPFIRCGVFIIHENEKVVEVYLSTPDGQSLAVLHLPFDYSDVTSKTVDSWRKGKVYHQHWNKEDFINWSGSLMAQGQIQSPETYQGAAAPPESLDLHFIPFTQGMLYVGAPHLLSDGEIDLVQALADAFAIAYARYEDFIKLDKAKENIEVTLTELKATQAQLIQKEKLASLGELTAGIAHEIQNPLNFVNNFSEVNVELMEELSEELQKGNLPEARAIISDLSGNERKILYHGRRADAIVRGMLEHARATPGERQLTDLNALADEYLRLAYHGIRAKDSTFTCALETDYDPDLGRIHMVAPDIGRVLLNLYTNAFYALQQKRVQAEDGFIPTVWVSTRRRNGNVEIRVRDNGGGIAEAIREKVFQPFFTTKPTGEGTGLGLSLSYDIITKGHGGRIEVESAENSGTTFNIVLPVT